MKIAVAIIFFTALAAAEVQFQHLEEWQLWKTQHGMSYQSQREELDRHLIWLANRQFIIGHNMNAHIFGFSLAMNKFGDISDTEYQEMLMTYKKSMHSNHTQYFNPSLYSGRLPQSVDWRNFDAVTKVKDQGMCGASYTFSAAGTIEGAWALAKTNLVELSEQNIIDCSGPYGNRGCRGGNVLDTFHFIIANEGIDTEGSYKYKGKQSSCSYTMSNRGAMITGSVGIKCGSESDLQSAVANVGPISVVVDSNSNTFRFYSKGVFSSTSCSSTVLTHSMLVTGYGTYDGKDYYLVKNSWGKHWGMVGYILMARNRYNQCGIASDASYPVL